MKYTICEMNGLYRVYVDKPIITGLATFKTRKGAENFIKRRGGKQ